MKCKNCSGDIPTSQRAREKGDCICTNPAPYSRDFYIMEGQLTRIENDLILIKQHLGLEPKENK